MKRILSAFAMFVVFLVAAHAGPICDFKQQDLKARIDYAKNKGLQDEVKTLDAQLKDFSKTCKDSDILEDINQNIQNTQRNLKNAASALHQAQLDGNTHILRQAQIDYKVANLQYVAAKQEMLRMKDLLKSAKNKK